MFVPSMAKEKAHGPKTGTGGGWGAGYLHHGHAQSRVTLTPPPRLQMAGGAIFRPNVSPMSAFRGKADIILGVAKCPLLATSGHWASVGPR